MSGTAHEKPASAKSPPAKSALTVRKVSAARDDDDDGDDSENPWTKDESRGTYRTVCVRMCDGYYFPISFATTKEHFGRDAKVCERSCKSPARLFHHENPGQDPEDMEDAKGKRYKDLKIAFLHRKQYDEACTCKPQPWDEAAVARHRQFADLAERKKGGRKSDPQSKIAHSTNGPRAAPTDAASAAISTDDDRIAAIPPALRVLSELRRQSLLPGAIRAVSIDDGVRIPFAHKGRRGQTTLSDVRRPRQSPRPASVATVAARPLVDHARATEPTKFMPARASGPPASGKPPTPTASTQRRHAAPEKLAEGSETQLR